MKYIVWCHGERNKFGVASFIGPFDTREAAEEWMDSEDSVQCENAHEIVHLWTPEF